MIKFLFLFVLILLPSISPAQLLPPIPTKTGAFTLTSQGRSRVMNWANHILDIVCLAGQYQTNKWIGLNVKTAGTGVVYALWARGTQACLDAGGFDSYHYDQTNNCITQAWGVAANCQNDYIETCAITNGSNGPIYNYPIRSDMNFTGDYRCVGTATSLGSPLSDYKIVGRKNINREWGPYNGWQPVLYVKGGITYTTCCNPTNYADANCRVSVWCTVVQAKNNLGVNISTGEFSNLYIPNPFPFASKFRDYVSGTGGGHGPVIDMSSTDSGAAANDYEDYLNKGYFQLQDGDIDTFYPPVDVSTSVISNQYIFTSSTTVNVDLSSTNLLLNGISSNTSQTNNLLQEIKGQFNNLLSSGTVDISTTAHWSDWENFNQTYSSIPISIMGIFVPASSETWRPCFDMGFLWSGLWTSGKPADTEICMSDFAGWDIFLELLHYSFMLIALWYGCMGILDAASQARIPGVWSVTWRLALITVVTGSLTFSLFIYQFISAAILALATMVGSALAYIGWTAIENAGILPQMFNYTGLTAALGLYISLLQVRWNILLFLNFWGAIAR